MKPQYEPIRRLQFYGYFVEEAGELLAAIGKTLRWGETSFNPEIPEKQRELNIDWMRRELKDLKGAIWRLEGFLDQRQPLQHRDESMSDASIIKHIRQFDWFYKGKQEQTTAIKESICPLDACDRIEQHAATIDKLKGTLHDFAININEEDGAWRCECCDSYGDDERDIWHEKTCPLDDFQALT